MGGSLLFVHGTGVKDVSGTLKQLREGLGPLVGVPKERVIGVQWGMQDAPPTLEVAPALPLVATKGIDDGAPGGQVAEDRDSIWELLTTDPLVELRLLATRESDDGLDVMVGDDLPDAQLQSSLDELSVDADLLAKVEITESQLAEAAQEVGGSEELGEAATAAGDAGYEELLEATARSVVACLLRDCGDLPPDKLPKLCTDAAVRDELVRAVLDDLQPGIKGFFSRAAKAVLLPLATRAAVRKRADYMVGTVDFLRDVAFYVRRGEKIRKRVQIELAELAQDEPVVLLGHSLGGIAAVDLLSKSIDERVDLLVTVGSQAPLLYLMDALEHLRPASSKAKPFTPWLNIYDRNDLLSFCAERVWPNTTGIEDHEVESRIPFPTSHSAYWSQERLYQVLADRWPNS
jgi:hypothetical protein